jgi:hypothetical protein
MGDERTLLELALELEQAAPWPSLNRRVPEELSLPTQYP